MRKVAIIAATALLVSCWSVILTYAADKSGPPATLEQILKAPDASALRGCWVETAASGTFFAAGDRAAHGVIGAGCNVRVDRGFIGGGIRGYFGDEQGRAGSLNAKLGFALNPHTDLYGLVEFKAKDFKLGTTGQLFLGLGAETALFTDRVSGFAEVSTAVSKWGTGMTKEDYILMLGIKLRPFQ